MMRLTPIYFLYSNCFLPLMVDSVELNEAVEFLHNES